MHKIDGPGNVNGQFVSENASTGQAPAEVTPEWLNAVQNELAAVVQDAGISLNKLDNTQLAQAIQSGALNAAYASGTADAITATFTPAITAWKEMPFFVRATAANATAAPTFTPNSGTVAAMGIVKGAGMPLVPGDIPGAGYWMSLRYDATLGKVVLMNPATGLRAQVQTITAVPTSGALVFGLVPISLDFRSATQSSGVVNTRTFASALSLTVPAGATLGTTAATSARLVLLALDNAGAVELAVVNLSGSTNLDESTLISTTAISSTSSSVGVIYSQMARSTVPFRVVGFIDITEATAGTWATPPTSISGLSVPFAAATQVGFQQNTYIVADAGGTADAITAAYSPAITALSKGMSLLVRAVNANITATPTFTPAVGTIPAKTIVKGINAALAAGDIAGAGHWIELQYDVSLDKWVLFNPATGIKSGVQIYSISSLPSSNVGPILVTECQEIWNWVSTAYFTGYRSLLCGRAHFGHTADPLPFEVDAVGGTLSKATYARLWGYAQENSLVVSAASWVAGTHYFVDVDTNTFRVPDLRNQFLRMTGTDADTANAVVLGSFKMDTFKSHAHSQMAENFPLSGGGGAIMGRGVAGSGGATSATGTAETAPRHTSYKPRIHV